MHSTAVRLRHRPAGHGDGAQERVGWCRHRHLHNQPILWRASRWGRLWPGPGAESIVRTDPVRTGPVREGGQMGRRHPGNSDSDILWPDRAEPDRHGIDGACWLTHRRQASRGGSPNGPRQPAYRIPATPALAASVRSPSAHTPAPPEIAPSKDAVYRRRLRRVGTNCARKTPLTTQKICSTK